MLSSTLTSGLGDRHGSSNDVEDLGIHHSRVCELSSTLLVVVSRLHDDEFFVPELIDKAVFVGDAARPAAGQVM
jgi:hypothetical protein